MEEKENNKTTVSDFTSLLLRKGYRRKFTLRSTAEPKKPIMTGNLSKCLEYFLQVTHTGKTDEFVLSTFPPYSDHLECTFKGEFDQVLGFLIKELTIQDLQSQESRYYRIRGNQQVPGAMSIQGLFPKPKPWEDHLKGRFRI